MPELICRNEPQHFFCLYNILRVFDDQKEVDVENVYDAMKNKRKCIAFSSTAQYCPVTFNNKPCALIRKSYGSIIREQLYALEALSFIQRKQHSRKLNFIRTSLGNKASTFYPQMLPEKDIDIGVRELDLSKKSTKEWIKCCRTGLSIYGPFIGYIWKLKKKKKDKKIVNEIGERAVNTFRLWARECKFISDSKVKVPIDIFERKLRIRNWVTRKFRNVPPRYQKDTTRVLFLLKKTMLNRNDLDISFIKNKKKQKQILLNLENTGIVLKYKDKNLLRIQNDFYIDEFMSSIKNKEMKKRLFGLLKNEKVDEEIADELIDKMFEVYPENKLKSALIKFIEARSKENAKKLPPSISTKTTRLKRDYKLYAALKKYHNYRCQVDGYTFKKKNGEYYCEIAHINEFSNSRDDTKENILILCANCHRSLDYGGERTRSKILEKVHRLIV